MNTARKGARAVNDLRKVYASCGWKTEIPKLSKGPWDFGARQIRVTATFKDVTYPAMLFAKMGEVGRFLISQQLDLLGKDRDNLSESDIKDLVKGIKDDFEKVIGVGVYELEKELIGCLEEEA